MARRASRPGPRHQETPLPRHFGERMLQESHGQTEARKAVRQRQDRSPTNGTCDAGEASLSQPELPARRTNSTRRRNPICRPASLPGIRPEPAPVCCSTAVPSTATAMSPLRSKCRAIPVAPWRPPSVSTATRCGLRSRVTWRLRCTGSGAEAFGTGRATTPRLVLGSLPMAGFASDLHEGRARPQLLPAAQSDLNAPSTGHDPAMPWRTPSA